MMQLCLLDLLDDGDEEGGTAEEWVNLINRGDLKHINESTFHGCNGTGTPDTLATPRVSKLCA